MSKPTEPLYGTAARAVRDELRTAGLTPAVLDLLAAIRDAAEVPLPALGEADEHAWHRLMARRLSDLHITLSVALSPEWVSTTDPARDAAEIRRRTEACPVTYALWQADQPRGERA